MRFLAEEQRVANTTAGYIYQRRFVGRVYRGRSIDFWDCGFSGWNIILRERERFVLIYIREIVNKKKSLIFQRKTKREQARLIKSSSLTHTRVWCSDDNTSVHFCIYSLTHSCAYIPRTRGLHNKYYNPSGARSRPLKVSRMMHCGENF